MENTGDHGSSRVYPPYVVTPLDGLKRYFGPGVEIIHRDETQVVEARRLAGEVDCVIIIAGNDFNDEGEYVSPGGTADMIAPLRAAYWDMGKPFKAALLKLVEWLGPLGQNKEVLAPGGDRRSLSLKPEQTVTSSGQSPGSIRTLSSAWCAAAWF